MPTLADLPESPLANVLSMGQRLSLGTGPSSLHGITGSRLNAANLGLLDRDSPFGTGSGLGIGGDPMMIGLFNQDYTFFHLSDDSAPGEDCEDCTNQGPYIQVPKLSDVRPETKACFETAFGRSTWPTAACCCTPSLLERSDCSLPTLDEWIDQLVRTLVLNATSYRHSRPASDLGADKWVNPTAADLELYFSALTLLQQNIDIATWAACTVEHWSPEISGLQLAEGIRALLGQGAAPAELAVAFVGTSTSNSSATGWAKVRGQAEEQGFPLTLIIPLGHSLWEGMRSRYAAGGPDAVCALTQSAQVILHEMVHVLGDRYRGTKWTGYGPEWADFGYGSNGTVHDDNAKSGGISAEEAFDGVTCFDECRMVASMFVWGVYQRYPCLRSASSCSFMGDPLIYANSINGGG